MMHLDCLLQIHGGLVEKAKGVRSLEGRQFGAISESASDPLRTVSAVVGLVATSITVAASVAI